MSDLIEILRHIEKRPGMYFGNADKCRSNFVLQAFIMGYQAAQLTEPSGVLNCFREWVASHYHVLADGGGGFEVILEQVGGDERKAYDEFFRIWPDYVADREQIGLEGIQLRFSQSQEQILSARRRKPDK